MLDSGSDQLGAFDFVVLDVDNAQPQLHSWVEFLQLVEFVVTASCELEKEEVTADCVEVRQQVFPDAGLNLLAPRSCQSKGARLWQS